MAYMLRFKTYLAPGIPIALYQHMINYLENKLNLSIELIANTTQEEQKKTKFNPFALNQIDIGHLDTQSYLRMKHAYPATVEILPIGPLINTPRTHKPEYFIDLVVAQNSPIQTYTELTGKKVATSCTHTHHAITNTQMYTNNLAPLEQILTGSTDAAIIDSHIINLHHKENQVKILTSWGPYPMQPLVIRKGFDPYLKQEMLQALKHMHTDPEFGYTLAQYRLTGFGDMNEQDFIE